MIGLDANVVVRYLAQDDPDQSAAASALMDELTETNPGYLSLVTVVEIYWVLRRSYGVTAARGGELLDGLVHARELRIDRGEVVRAALTAAESGVDFPDAVIAELGRGAGCRHTVTFDRRAARSGAMHLLGAARPGR
ncbi:type II toxin-antitoxin system VapC family toxin [Acidiferrimicrobium sp. IK]|uniref:PIN domain-containing protein n=1 Tax=Acidiferrimicrobium sp. IK TaxID=2871700 RepID=UPI0021CAFD1F|nr:type II toxin-antitoxin system VapC family toxin [Acidiferrimicrobium sp. IK]MCU4187163.1 type II toxin-antitoxin system VapC family toxin [Acidiferrimicrobium sp. IK]